VIIGRQEFCVNRTLPSVSLLLLTLSGLALAAPTLNLSLMKVITVVKDGVKSETLSPADKVMPGDTLMQRATLRTDKALKGGHIVLPVPKNTRYLPGTASTFQDLTLDYSADGKTFSAKPMKAVTVTENGKTVQKQVMVPENEYTALRWTVVSLPKDATVTVNYRVSVN